MTKYRIFKVKGKNYKRSSRIKVEQITSSSIIDGEKIIPKNLGDRRIIKHYTTTAEGYQLKVVWWYQCKKDYPLWHKDAIGTSFKPRKGEDYITKVTQLPLQQMLKDADAMAWINYKCSPLAEFRKTVILEHYLPAKESPIRQPFYTLLIVSFLWYY
jgi:hypothetical protein